LEIQLENLNIENVVQSTIYYHSDF
jgi:hypothetical protein